MTKFIPLTKLYYDSNEKTFKECYIVHVNVNHILSMHLEKHHNLVHVELDVPENYFYVKESLSEITMCL